LVKPKVAATEEVEIDEDHKVGDKVHAGFGAKGGAGFKGTVHKVENGFVHINIGKGKYGDRIVKAPKRLVTKEEVEIEEANFKTGDKVSYETSKSNKNNKGVVHSVKGDTVTIKGSNYLGGEVLHDVHHSMVRKEEVEIEEENKDVEQNNANAKNDPKSKKKIDDKDMDTMDAKEIKGGKTEVDLKPKTDDSPEEANLEDKKSKSARDKANKEIGAKGVKEETMTNKNFGLPESLLQTVNEVLKGKQHKIDANHNGKIDAEDFKLLKSKKKMSESKCTKCGMDPCKCDHMKEAKSCACEGKGPCQCSPVEEAAQINEGLHRVGVWTTEPEHASARKREARTQKVIRVSASSKEEAEQKARSHFEKQGKYKVHKTQYMGSSSIKEENGFVEEVEQIDEKDMGSKKLEINISGGYMSGGRPKFFNRYITPMKPKKMNNVNDAPANMKNKIAKEEAEHLDEISKKTAMSAYQSATFVDDEHPKADAIRGHIEKKWGKEMGKHADAHAHLSNYPRHNPFQKDDKLKSAKPASKMRTTASGKIHKQDIAAKKTEIKSRMKEEVELSAEELARIEEIAKGL